MKRNKPSRPSPLLVAVGATLIAIGLATDRVPLTLIGIAVNAVYLARFFRC